MKTLILTIAFASFITKSLSQTLPELLHYYKTTNTLKPVNGTDLTKGSYNFQIDGLNDAYHIVKFNPEYLDRVGTMPTGLPTLILNTTPTPAASHYSLVVKLKTSAKNIAGNEDITDLLAEIS